MPMHYVDSLCVNEIQNEKLEESIKKRIANLPSIHQYYDDCIGHLFCEVNHSSAYLTVLERSKILETIEFGITLKIRYTTILSSHDSVHKKLDFFHK
jgi:hypothetical protein